MTKQKEPPYIKGEAKVLDENGKVIGMMTVAYNNPKYKPWCDLPKTEGN